MPTPLYWLQYLAQYCACTVHLVNTLQIEMSIYVILIILFCLHNKSKGISDILDVRHFAVRTDRVFIVIKK